ncbi:MAG: Enoyl-CoA hydratase/isomerase [Rhizobacter sp.]|nr:Enoyl-CoA hydratase/isomerase [Rhizobacter sp.]
MNDGSAVVVSADEHVATITLNRPGSLNSLDYPMATALRDAIDEVAARKPRVVVLRGAGSAFCGGGDVAAMHAHRDDLPAFIDRMIDAFHASILALRRLRAPVIASVHGAVAGGGFSLALACDLVVAARDTRFVVAYPKLGASSDGGLSFYLTQRLGAARGLELLTVGGRIDPQQALALGLINQIADDGELAAHTLALVQSLLSLPTQSVSELKGLVAAQSIEALERHLDREKAAFIRCSRTPDFAARVAAFVQKQPAAS